MSLRFVHVSDIHLLDLRGVRPWDYLNKRITGRVNLVRRRHLHDERIFDAACAKARELGVDRLVVTGDLTNLSLPSEFAHVARKLAALGLPVTVVPGNHDAYVRGVWRDGLFERTFAAFMEGERAGEAYPFLQRHEDVALVGVSTAVPTPPLDATGEVGDAQLARLEAMLRQTGEEKLCRVVLIHHPVVEGTAKHNHRLHDLAAFDAVIARTGAELILHGHEHHRIDATLPGPSGDVPVHGIGSSTSTSQRPGHEAALALYEAGSAGIHRELYVWNASTFVRT
jgi:3',5'-cyclic AMP phosphodiesterase CpdA